MSNLKKLAQTYAKSLFVNIKNVQPKEETRFIFDVSDVYVAQEVKFTPNIYIVGEELLILRSILISSKVMKDYFSNPTYSEKQKLKLLIAMFPGLTIPVKSFLRILTERSILSLIPEICEEYNKLLLEFKKIRKVKLVVASSLEESYGPLLLKTLKQLTNSNTVLLNVFHNPRILGGLIIEYKSTLIDLSLLKEFSLLLNEV